MAVQMTAADLKKLQQQGLEVQGLDLPPKKSRKKKGPVDPAAAALEQATKKPSEAQKLVMAFTEAWARLAPAGAPQPQAEVKVVADRKWAYDYGFPAWKVAVELEGGVFTGGRHTRGMGYVGDCDKYNTGTSLGWSIIRLTVAHLRNGREEEAVAWILEALKRKGCPL